MMYTSCAPKFSEGSGWLWHAERLPPWPIVLTDRVVLSVKLWEVVKINGISLPFTPRDHSVILQPERPFVKLTELPLLLKKNKNQKLSSFSKEKIRLWMVSVLCYDSQILIMHTRQRLHLSWHLAYKDFTCLPLVYCLTVSTLPFAPCVLRQEWEQLILMRVRVKVTHTRMDFALWAAHKKR